MGSSPYATRTSRVIFASCSPHRCCSISSGTGVLAGTVVSAFCFARRQAGRLQMTPDVGGWWWGGREREGGRGGGGTGADR